MKKCVLPLLLLLIACNDPSDCTCKANFVLGKPFTMLLGEQRTEEGGGLTVLLKSLYEDSRCPTTVECVWQGQVSMVVEYQLNQFQQTDTLTLLSGDSTAQHQGHFQGYTITMNTVDPYPPTTAPIPMNEYQVSFTVDQ